ncbi:MAG TPA: O-antigen ligase family protein [Terracidiphilus sp.]|jgi:hypothetical protein|nr:O-antigen ligase family protein [Terracidiphilus sp.]
MIADRFIAQTRPTALGSAVEGRALLLTPYLVGFYLSFRSAIVLIAVRVFLLEPQTGAAFGLMLDFVLLFVVAFQAWGANVHSVRWMLRIASLRWVCAYLAFAGCSLAWSGTVSPSASFVYWCGVVADVAIVVLMLRAAPIEEVTHSLFKGFVVSACVVAAIAWMMPAPADLRLGDPEYLNTNQIGNLCAFGVLFAQYLMSRKDGHWGLVVGFLAITLVRSLSKTTLAAFLLAEGVLLVRDRAVSKRAKVLLCSLVLMAGLAFWGLFDAYYDTYTTTGNQAETLTGRTAIWAYALNAAVEKPWIGNGFDALWKVMPPLGPDQFEARHAENEVLQQFFAYGAVGVALLIGLYRSVYRHIRKLPVGPPRLVLLTILLFVLVRGLAEAEPFDLLLPLWAIALLSILIEATPHTKCEEVIA